jgi:hypothetical protein
MMVAVVVTLVVIAVVVALVVIAVVVALVMIAAVVSTLVAVVLVVVVVSTGDQLQLRRGQLRQLLKRHGKGSSSSQPSPGVRRLDGGRSPRAFDR